MFKQRFIGEIRTTFGSGGFVCSFSERELADFHNYLERSFPFSDAGKVKKGVTCVGKQPATQIWVFNEAVQINEDGNLLQPGSSQFAWTPIGGPCIELVYGRSGSAGTIDIKSEIMTPLESHEPLYNLLTSMQETLKHNFIAGEEYYLYPWKACLKIYFWCFRCSFCSFWCNGDALWDHSWYLSCLSNTYVVRRHRNRYTIHYVHTIIHEQIYSNDLET